MPLLPAEPSPLECDLAEEGCEVDIPSSAATPSASSRGVGGLSEWSELEYELWPSDERAESGCCAASCAAIWPAVGSTPDDRPRAAESSAAEGSAAPSACSCSHHILNEDAHHVSTHLTSAGISIFAPLLKSISSCMIATSPMQSAQHRLTAISSRIAPSKVHPKLCTSTSSCAGSGGALSPHILALPLARKRRTQCSFSFH